MKRYLRFTDYGGRDDGTLLVTGWQAGVEKHYEQSEAMPMWSADDGLPAEIEDGEERYWTVISEKLGRITFQSIDLEEDTDRPKVPPFRAWCKFHGHDPEDDTWWEVYSEWRAEALVVQQWVVEGDYGQGWEIVWHAEDELDARRLLEDYRRAQPRYPHRVRDEYA